MKVDAIIYVGEDGTIAVEVWKHGRSGLGSPVFIAGGYKTVGDAKRAYKAVARKRGLSVVDVHIAVDQ